MIFLFYIFTIFTTSAEETTEISPHFLGFDSKLKFNSENGILKM